MTLEEYLEAVAARTPAPGGGASAAVACALAAALTAMAARFAERDPEIERADALRAEALQLAEADLEAYAPVLEALRRPADDPGRDAALAAASSAAADVPLRIAVLAAETAALARALAEQGRPGLRGDALAGADLAAGAARAAARLVEINLSEAPGDPRLAAARSALGRAAG